MEIVRNKTQTPSASHEIMRLQRLLFDMCPAAYDMEGCVFQDTKAEEFLLMGCDLLLHVPEADIAAGAKSLLLFLKRHHISLEEVLTTLLQNYVLLNGIRAGLCNLTVDSKLVLFELLEEYFPDQTGFLLTMGLVIQCSETQQ